MFSVSSEKCFSSYHSDYLLQHYFSYIYSKIPHAHSKHLWKGQTIDSGGGGYDKYEYIKNGTDATLYKVDVDVFLYYS